MTDTIEGADTELLLVGISNPATAPRLVQLSRILSAGGTRNVLLTHVVTVADQISLTTGQSSPEVVRARDFLRDVQEGATAEGLKASALVEVARSVDEGLLAAAESHQADMILVGYSEIQEDLDQKDEERFDRTMHRVARRAEVDVLVAKFRRDDMDSVLVPIADTRPGALLGQLARALKESGGVELTFLHIAEPGEDRDAEARSIKGRLATANLDGLGSVEVLSSHDPVGAILQKSHEFDLILVVPSSRPGIMDGVFTSKARALAEEAPASVLQAWSEEGEGGV